MHNLLKTLSGAALVLCLVFPLNAQNLNFQLRSSITYPGQTLANICGWTSPDGHEYALIGAQKGLIITDITNPDAPVQIVQIPGPNNLWKEIKTYSHYAYVTSEGGGGVQIVDLSGLPSANLPYHNYTGNGNIPQQMTSIHALHIDTKKGFLYTYGGNLNSASVHDLNADPYNPTYVGRFNDLGYIHDGYAENDTLYACHIYDGLLSIVDMSNKTAPVILGTVQTPGKFTHNSWLLADHKHILTTDETLPSFVTSYDISDPTDIKELDRFSIDNGQGSIGHNVQVINDYTVTSWYTGGVVITDCHRPQNLVKVAHYDTYALSGPQEDGCWGAYPYFPSGTVIASNIPTQPGNGELFILTPTYVRASYLEGLVRDGCTGLPLAGATVEIIGGDAGSTDVSNNAGIVRTGQVTPGVFTVQVSKAGYITQTFQATLTTAEVTNFDVTLQSPTAINITGTVVDAQNNPIANIPVGLSGPGGTYNLTSNANGTFTLNCILPGDYFLSAGVWGNVFSNVVNINGSTALNIVLEKKYYDNFSSNFNWTTSATSPTGLWELGEPVLSDFNGNACNPDEDVQTDIGDQCYVTGNSGGSGGSDDVDNGSVTLTTPAMLLAGAGDALLTFNYWFVNTGGNGTAPNDQFEVHVSNGITEVPVFNTNISASQWKESPVIHLGNFIALNNNVKVSFIATDNDPGHIVDAAVDVFSVVPVPVSVTSIAKEAVLTVSPNPSSSEFNLQYAWPGTETVMLEVHDVLGHVVFTQTLSGEKGNGRFGEKWPSGVYLAYITNGQQKSEVVRMVKQ